MREMEEEGKEGGEANRIEQKKQVRNALHSECEEA